MSHIPERKEKDCLNCGAIVQGHYCHQCGQENVIPKETFWHMFTHFFYDITHFDSNFFHTIRHLVVKPGFLSKEYMMGRRVSYLHPIRMYMFTSAIFFLLFFSLFKTKDVVTLTSEKPLNDKQRADYIISLQNRIKKDSTNKALVTKLILFQDTTRLLTPKDTLGISFNDTEIKSLAAYDSVQKNLPSVNKDGWFKNRLAKQRINIIHKFQENPEETVNKLMDGFLHRLPYLLFVSLPLFALILKLIYIRRKKFYFADHGVFTIHLYVFSFILIMMAFSLGKLEDNTGWKFMGTIAPLLLIVLFGYLYLAMKNFYQQGWGKTVIKLLVLTILSLIMMIILFAIFLLFSATTI